MLYYKTCFKNKTHKIDENKGLKKKHFFIMHRSIIIFFHSILYNFVRNKKINEFYA
jgi:hypothetical protein